MKFDNATPYPALLEVGSTSDAEQIGSVACKVTYQWDDAGAITPVPRDAQWDVARAPERYQGALLLPDADFRRQGIDLLLFGDAVAPGGESAAHWQVGVQSGGFACLYDAWGERRWQRQRGQDGAADTWRISAPQPVPRVPLTAARAFGGRTQVHGQLQLFAMNPGGIGYVMHAEAAEGAALPQFERPDARIAHWSDTPVPACFHKPEGGLLLPASGPDAWAEVTRAGPQRLAQVTTRESFQQAPPDWVCPRGQLGAQLTLHGLDARGVVPVALPPEVASRTQGPVVGVQVGPLRAQWLLRIASLLVLLPQRLLVVCYAASFRYRIQPGDARHARLDWHGAHSFAPEGAP